MSTETIFIITVLLSSFVSGFTGMGGGVILLTVMIPMFPPHIIIPLHGVIQLASNFSRVVTSPDDIDFKVFIIFSLGALLGCFAVLPINLDINTDFITLLMIISILIFTWIPLKFITNRFKGSFFVIGVVSSFLSNFIGSTGPLSAPFFLHSHLKQSNFVVTKAACQLPVHLFKVIVYIISGFILKDWIYYILTAIPLVLTGNMIGKYFTNKIPGNHYNVVIKIVITLITVRMLVKILS